MPEADPPDDFWKPHDDGYNDQLVKPDTQSHRVMGHPHWVRRYARRMAQLASHGLYCGRPEDDRTPRALELAAGAQDWRPLWELGIDTAEYDWKYGSLFVRIRDEDLQARAFERCWVFVQMT